MRREYLSRQQMLKGTTGFYVHPSSFLLDPSGRNPFFELLNNSQNYYFPYIHGANRTWFFLCAKFQLRGTVRTNYRPYVVPKWGAFSEPLADKIPCNSAHCWLSRCYQRGCQAVCQNCRIMAKMPLLVRENPLLPSKNRRTKLVPPRAHAQKV